MPGTHRSGRLPAEALEDPRAPHADETLVTGRAGDVVVMNAHLWHAGTANRSPRRRLALHSFYCRSDKPQQQYQKRLLRPETQARLTPEARALLALDDPLNDALSAAGEGGSGFLGAGLELARFTGNASVQDLTPPLLGTDLTRSAARGPGPRARRAAPGRARPAGRRAAAAAE